MKMHNKWDGCNLLSYLVSFYCSLSAASCDYLSIKLVTLCSSPFLKKGKSTNLDFLL